MRCKLGLLAVGMLIVAPTAFARIKMTSLPNRERVEIQLDHGRYTLVEEERIVPLLAVQQPRAWQQLRRLQPGRTRRSTRTRSSSARLPSGKGDAVSSAIPDDRRPGRDRGDQRRLPAQRERARVGDLRSRKRVRPQGAGELPDLETSRAPSRTARWRTRTRRTWSLKKYIQLRNYSGRGLRQRGRLGRFRPEVPEARSASRPTRKMLLERSSGVPIRKTFLLRLVHARPAQSRQAVRLVGS